MVTAVARTRITSHRRVNVRTDKTCRQLRGKGGHSLRMEPRCTVIEFCRFDSCQVRSGLVGSEAPFLVDKSPGPPPLRQKLRNDVVSALQQSCNPSQGRALGDITLSVPEAPRMMSRCRTVALLLP